MRIWKRKYEAATASSYLEMQLGCILAGAHADLYATQIEDLQSENVRVYVGVNEFGMIVAGAYTRRLEMCVSELCGVIVHPEHRRRRYGTELVQYIIGSEEATGVERIELVVRIYADGTLNEKAAKLYGCVGFSQTGEIRVGEFSDNPRLTYLSPTVETDGKYRAAVFAFVIEQQKGVFYG